jgi:uncharacterized membrane protein
MKDAGRPKQAPGPAATTDMTLPIENAPIPAARLIVLGFDNMTEAFEMRTTVDMLRKVGAIEAVETVVVTRDEAGKVALHQEENLAVIGAVYGSFLGWMVSLIFLNPVGVLVGMGIGALSGKLGDVGINDVFMKQLGATLTPGTSALFVLVRQSRPDEVIEGLQRYAGRCRFIQAELAPENEARLRALLEKKDSAKAPK